MTRTPERLCQLLASVNAVAVGDHVAGLCHEAAELIRPLLTSGDEPDWFEGLRQANRVRQGEWDKDGSISLSYRGNELGGEAGEAQNIIKKLERERMGIRGSRATLKDLADELADVVICCDLIASAEGIGLSEAVATKFNATSEKYGLRTRMKLRPPVPGVGMGHKTRFSDSSLYDEVCTVCGATDNGGGLNQPCPGPRG